MFLCILRCGAICRSHARILRLAAAQQINLFDAQVYGDLQHGINNTVAVINHLQCIAAEFDAILLISVHIVFIYAEIWILHHLLRQMEPSRQIVPGKNQFILGEFFFQCLICLGRLNAQPSGLPALPLQLCAGIDTKYQFLLQPLPHFRRHTSAIRNNKAAFALAAVFQCL